MWKSIVESVQEYDIPLLKSVQESSVEFLYRNLGKFCMDSLT